MDDFNDINYVQHETTVLGCFRGELYAAGASPTGTLTVRRTHFTGAAETTYYVNSMREKTWDYCIIMFDVIGYGDCSC